MNEVQLEVSKAYPNDSGRGIARLDPDTLLHLKLSPGDIIEIEGGSRTAAKVWRADRQDWNTDTVRIDGFTRQNADVGIGERVTIRKAEATKAETLVLAPPEEASVQFGSDAAGMVKRQILKRPVVERDIVPVMSSTNHPFMRSPMPTSAFWRVKPSMRTVSVFQSCRSARQTLAAVTSPPSISMMSPGESFRCSNVSGSRRAIPRPESFG
jgi:hypothetical protein